MTTRYHPDLEAKAAAFKQSVSESADAGYQRAKQFADSVEAKVDEVPAEVQSKAQAEYANVVDLYENKKPFKFILVAGGVLIVLAVIAGVIL